MFSANQNNIAPGTVLASIGFDFTNFYKWAVGKYLKGELTGGKVNKAGIKEGLYIPYYGPTISQKVKDDVAKATKAIIAGKVDFKSMFSGSY